MVAICVRHQSLATGTLKCYECLRLHWSLLFAFVLSCYVRHIITSYSLSVRRLNARFPVEACSDGAWMDIASALKSLKPTPTEERIRVKISGMHIGVTSLDRLLLCFWQNDDIYFRFSWGKSTSKLSMLSASFSRRQRDGEYAHNIIFSFYKARATKKSVLRYE